MSPYTFEPLVSYFKHDTTLFFTTPSTVYITPDSHLFPQNSYPCSHTVLEHELCPYLSSNMSSAIMTDCHVLGLLERLPLCLISLT